MLSEQFRRCPAELVHIGARGVEDGEQRLRVFAHCVLDQNWLVQLGFPQSDLDLGGGLIDTAATASATHTQPSLPMKPGRAETMTHEYKRHGTVDLFAAMNIATGGCLYWSDNRLPRTHRAIFDHRRPR